MGNSFLLEACYSREANSDQQDISLKSCLERIKVLDIDPPPELPSKATGSSATPDGGSCSDHRFGQLTSLSGKHPQHSEGCCLPLDHCLAALQSRSNFKRRRHTHRRLSLEAKGGPRLFAPKRSNPASAQLSGRADPCTGDVGSLIDLGRFLEAEQLLSSSASTDQERIVRRVVDQYRTSIPQLLPDAAGGDWMQEVVNDALSFKFRVDGDELHVVIVMEFEAIDPMHVLAALVETDLCQGFRPSLLSATRLCGKPSGSDTLWHVTQKNVAGANGGNEDLIWHLSVVDALQEDGWLWVGFYSPPLEAEEVDGVRLPMPAEGDARIESSVATVVVPRLHGATASMSGVVKMAGVSQKVMTVTPMMFLRRFLRDLIVIPTASSFRQHAETCKDLTARLAKAPSASVYGQVERQLYEQRRRVKASM